MAAQRRSSAVACSAATATRTGREGGVLQRKANQDACLALPGFQGEAQQALFGVFDGHGPAGELAPGVSESRVESRPGRVSMHVQPGEAPCPPSKGSAVVSATTLVSRAARSLSVCIF